MNAAESKVMDAICGHTNLTTLWKAVDAVLAHWMTMGSPVEWEEAIVRLADALIAESKNGA